MKKNRTTMILIALTVVIIGYLLYRNMSKNMKKTNGGGSTSNDQMPEGCHPFEEVHEVGSSHPGEMWLSIIPFKADGVTRGLRPPGSATSIGEQVRVENTNSALDGIYTINSIYYDSVGDIGSFRVDIPGGYNFNYNATQGGSPRDMTYFGVGRICLI